MNGKNYYLQQRRPNQSRDEFANDFTAPNYINENSFIGSLERKIQHQNQTINNLIKAVQDSRYEQQRQMSYFERLKQSEEQKYNLQILEELKSLKQKIKRIEQSPPVQQSVPQMYHQTYLPPLSSSFQPPYPPQYSNNYQIQNPFQQQIPLPVQQVQNSQKIVKKKKPREMDTLHKFLLKMLQEKQQGKKQKEDIDSKYVTDVESSQQSQPPSLKRETSKSPLIKSRQSRIRQKHKESTRSMPSDSNSHSQIYKTSHQSQQSNQTQQKKIAVSSQRLKELQRKFRAMVRYYWLAMTWQGFCQKIWIQKALTFKDWSQECIGKYDPEFNYLQIIGSFHRECVLKKSLDKSWVFTQTIDVQVRCQNLLNMLETIFRYLIIQSLDFTKQHLEFMRKMSLKKGYLLTGHSKYVVNRINLRPNQTLDIEKPEQSQMLLMEYSYIQIFLPLIVEADFWKKLVNYKEAVKILISALHYLFIDKFYNLQPSTQQLSFNQEFVPLFNFQRNPVEGFYQLINSQDPEYIEAKDEAVLGLYTKAQLHPLVLHVGFKKIQDNFKQYCELIYSLII